MQNAQILVVNHALLFSDIALRRAGVSILPDYDVVIFDEAHTVEGVASDHLGHQRHERAGRVHAQQAVQRSHEQGPAGSSRLAERSSSRSTVAASWPMNSLPTSGSGSRRDGWQTRRRGGPRQSPPRRISAGGCRAHAGVPIRRSSPIILSPELEVLAKQLKAAGKKLSEESEQQDFLSSHDRLMALAGELEIWRTQAQKGTVYWLESYEGRRGKSAAYAGGRAGRYWARYARAAI